MAMVRMNVTIPQELYASLAATVPPRRRSKFIATALDAQLRGATEERLAGEYREAAGEMRRINEELEGAIDDGLD